MILSISPDGDIRCLYTEALDLASLGTPRIRRASNVEYSNERNGWTVDLTLAGQPVTRKGATRLGPFPTRSEAIAAEVAWLEANIL